MQHSIDKQSIIATILSFFSRSKRFKIMLKTYRRQLQKFDELLVAIAKVDFLMGIRGFDDVKKNLAFVKDVLRIEVLRSMSLHLIVVNLSRLISIANEAQIEDDVQTI